MGLGDGRAVRLLKAFSNFLLPRRALQQQIAWRGGAVVLAKRGEASKAPPDRRMDTLAKDDLPFNSEQFAFLMRGRDRNATEIFNCSLRPCLT